MTAPSRKPWWRRPFGTSIIALVGIVALYFIAGLFLYRSYTVPTSSMENAILAGDRIWTNRSSDPPERGEIVAFEFPGMREEVVPRGEQVYLGRAVGIGGDTVEIRNNQLFVNGIAESAPGTLVYDTIPSHESDAQRSFPAGYGFTARNWGPIRVPKKGDRIDLNDPQVRAGWDVFIRRDMLASDPGLVRDDVLYGELPAEYTVRGDYFFSLGDNRNRSMDSRYWGFVPVTGIKGRPTVVYMSIDDEGGLRSDRMFKRIE